MRRTPIKNLSDTELYWLAGLLEGEGSFVKGGPSNPTRPCVALSMTDEDVVAKVANWFGLSYQKGKSKSYYRKIGRKVKPFYRLMIGHSKAIELMERIRPLMGIRRQQQIDRVLSAPRPRLKSRLSEDDVRLIRHRAELGETAEQISVDYGYKPKSIQQIIRGNRWHGV